MQHKPQLQDCPRTFPQESRSLRLSADKEASIHAAPRLRRLLFKGRTEQGGEDSSRIGCPGQAESKRWTSPTSWADTGHLTLGQKKMDKAVANSSDCWGKSKMESSLHSYNNLVIYYKFQGVFLGGDRWEGLNGTIKRVAKSFWVLIVCQALHIQRFKVRLWERGTQDRYILFESGGRW